MLMPFKPVGPLGPPPPADPTITGRAQAASAASNSTSYAAALPASITAGRLLVVHVSSDGNPTLSDGSGLWTKLGQVSQSTLQTSAVFWKIAAGSDTLTVTSSAAEQFSNMAWEIANVDTVEGASLNWNAADPNPPNLTLAAGSKKAIWLAVAGHNANISITAGPSGWSNFATQAGGASASSAAGCAAAELEATASSQDPGVFTMASTQATIFTLGIYKA
jgi:hypothetical protein